MTSQPSCLFRRSFLVALVAIVVAFSPRTASAWAIGSQINDTGCHGPITAQALRISRLPGNRTP
jgi:hypothetical protein